MSKQDIIIGNQKEIMKNINDIKETLNSHDKQLDMLTHDNAEVVKTTINKKKAKEGFTVSIQLLLIF